MCTANALMTPVLNDREATSVTIHLLTTFTLRMPDLYIHSQKLAPPLLAIWHTTDTMNQYGCDWKPQLWNRLIRLFRTVCLADPMQTVKLWWAFDWCVQQRELKLYEVWGLLRQSFHLNQPCLQCLCLNKSQAFLSERHTGIKLLYVQEWEKALFSSMTADIWPLSNEQT